MAETNALFFVQCLWNRAEFEDEPLSYVEVELAIRLQNRMPDRLRQFFGGSSTFKEGNDGQNTSVRTVVQNPKRIRLGIVFSKLYSHASQPAFEKFLTTFNLYRHKVVENSAAVLE